MNPDTVSVIRDFFIMVATGAFAALCLTVIVLIVKLYRPLLETMHNASQSTDNLSRVTGDFANVSEETANNVAQTSRNLVSITEKAKDGAEDLPTVVRTAGEAAKSVAEAAGTAAKAVEKVSRLIPEGTAGGASTSGIGPLLRFARSMFGSRRGSGSQKES